MSDNRLSRRSLVQLAGAGTIAAGAALPRRALAVVRPDFAPTLRLLSVGNGARPFAGDTRLLTTVSASPTAARASAYLGFTLDRAANLELAAIATHRGFEETVWTERLAVGAGAHRLEWKPDPALPARTYLLRLAVTDARGKRRVYGADRPYARWLPRAPVVRVLGAEAIFLEPSSAPGEEAILRVSTDAAELSIQLFRCGYEAAPTYRNDEMVGAPVTDPVTIDWQSHGAGPSRIRVGIGDWPSGVYFARLVADDGRVGFAPLVVRPATFGTSRVAVVVPTNSWQAYNYRDADGDGWGDTWYAGGNPPVDLQRPHLSRGVPFRFRSYDAGFLRWLAQGGKVADFLAEDDLDRFRTGDELAALYDLVVYSGHTEYVTAHEYDVVQRYRDLGGNLWFLSANNFFWEVEKRGALISRVKLWRELGRPEAGLIGAQYLASDDGEHQAPMLLAADAPAWAWQGTGLGPGQPVGSYGIEIDARAPESPPGTQVLATIPDAFGPGRTAEMTYYETAAGSRVFAAGALNFGGSAERWPVRQLLENLWARTAVR